MGDTGPIREDVMRAYRAAVGSGSMSGGDAPVVAGGTMLASGEDAPPLTEDVPALRTRDAVVRVEDNIAAMVVDDVPAATDGRLLLW
jgi:hypothetical protein